MILCGCLYVHSPLTVSSRDCPTSCSSIPPAGSSEAGHLLTGVGATLLLELVLYPKPPPDAACSVRNNAAITQKVTLYSSCIGRKGWYQDKLWRIHPCFQNSIIINTIQTLPYTHPSSCSFTPLAGASEAGHTRDSTTSCNSSPPARASGAGHLLANGGPYCLLDLINSQ